MWPFSSSPAPVPAEAAPPPPPPPPPPQVIPEEEKSTTRASATDTFFSSRSRRQFTIFAAGCTFTLLSAMVTRRRLALKHKATVPSFHHPSNARPAKPVNGAFEALEALNLATLNVFSGAIMVTGGVMWAADISDLKELQGVVRGGLGVDGTGKTEKEAEEDIEEWVASTLARKDRKEEERRAREGGAR
jgi:hypothetical protein